jgi:hypothetical protein
MASKYSEKEKIDKEWIGRWRKQYPSTTLRRMVEGDTAYARKFNGEGNKLLYELKNHMKLGKLDQLSMRRIFTDGTQVTAWSVFGLDFIKIDTRFSTGAIGGGTPRFESCNITFVDFPLYVPPMRHPDGIGPGEVQGIDYFKSYYVLDTARCPSCAEIKWEFLLRYLQSSPLVPEPVPPLPISTRIEWPVEPLHWHPYDSEGFVLEHDGYDHTLISEHPPAWGQVISHGSDNNGTYIIWKAYTENRDSEMSRSGLAIMRLVARIRDTSGVEICSQNTRVEIDCCLRDDIKVPDIYWEFSGDTCIDYGDTKLCKVPDYMTLSLFGWYASGESGWAARYYSIPEVGGCPIYEWTMTGPGRLYRSDIIWGRMVTYLRPEGGEINADVSITVTDRCGQSDTFFASCCETATPVSMGYTSLQMSCSGKQNLTASGGCGPYYWVLSGGGSLEYAGTYNETAVYTAPTTNPSCNGAAGNPTITLNDNCGSSATVTFAVNCWVENDPAFEVFDPAPPLYACGAVCNNAAIKGCLYSTKYLRYKCSGAYLGVGGAWGTAACEDPDAGWPLKFCSAFGDSCPDTCAQFPGIFRDNSENNCPNEYYFSCQCGETIDGRTQALLDGGCCPINPFTGLPF